MADPRTSSGTPLDTDVVDGRVMFCARCGDNHVDGGYRCWVPFNSDEFWRGAAIAFGLLGLGIALHDNAPMRCDECGEGALWDWRRTWPVFCNETCATKWCRRNIG